MEKNNDIWLNEQLDKFEIALLFGTDKDGLTTIHNKLEISKAKAILELKKYLELNYDQEAKQEIKLLYIFIHNLVKKDFKQISKMKNLNSIKLEFISEYKIFLKNIIDSEQRNAFTIIEFSLINNINAIIIFIENYYIHNTLSDDSKFEAEAQNEFSNPSLDMTKKSNKKKIKLAIKDTIFAKKIELLKNTFETVKLNLDTFLITSFKNNKDEIMTIFQDDMNDVYNTLSLKKPNSKKNQTYDNLFMYLSNNHFNYTLHDPNNGLYYLFIYDILMLKYKLLAIFKTYSFQEMREDDLEHLIANGLMHEIKDRKKYIRFFNTIKEVKNIKGYIYKLLSVNEKTPIRLILNLTDEKTPVLDKINIYPIFQPMLEKYSQITAFKSFSNLSYN